MGIEAASSLTDATNTACDLRLPDKAWATELVTALRDAGIDLQVGLDRRIIDTLSRIEQKWTYARLNGCFTPSVNTQYELSWAMQGPLITDVSPEFLIPQSLTLVECVYHLTTAATTTGPTVKVFKNGVEIASEAMGTSATKTESGLSTAFVADSDELTFQVSNLGDATARTLICYARFAPA